MKKDYVLALDVGKIFSSLGGERGDHRPGDKKLVLEQAKQIIDQPHTIFKFVVFSGEFTDAGEFLCVLEQQFRVSFNEKREYVFDPPLPQSAAIFNHTVKMYGDMVQREISNYIENAKAYYKRHAGQEKLGGLRIILPPGCSPEPESPSLGIALMPAPSPLG